MGQRNVYLPDALLDLLEHECRYNGQTVGKLLVTLARERLGLEQHEPALTARVLAALETPASAADVADRAKLSRRAVHETLTHLSRLSPSPVEVVDGAGASATWARVKTSEPGSKAA